MVMAIVRIHQYPKLLSAVFNEYKTIHRVKNFEAKGHDLTEYGT